MDVRVPIDAYWYRYHKGEPFPELYGKISQKEYIEDFENPLLACPRPPTWWIVVFFIPIIGAIIVLVNWSKYRAEVRKYGMGIIDNFNAKYANSRGVRLEYGDNYVTANVRQVCVVIPGVELYTPSKEALEAITAYQNGTYPTGKQIQPISDVNATPGMTYTV